MIYISGTNISAREYKVDLDSNVFFSSLTGPTIHSHRVYTIDWSFLPENKSFKMTFKIQSKARTLNGYNAGANVIRVRCNLEGMYNQNMDAGNLVSKKNNDFIGLMVIKRSSDTTNDNQLRTLPYHNPPVFLSSRPTGNFITIETLNPSGTRNTGITGSYLMTLYFEEI